MGHPTDSLLPTSFAEACVRVGDEVFLSGVPPTYIVTPSRSCHALVLGVCVERRVHQATLLLGKVHARHVLAAARNKLWWMTPEFGPPISQLPKEIQFMLAQTHAGTYVMLCPLICNDRFRATLQPAARCTQSPFPKHMAQQQATDPDWLCLTVSSGHSSIKTSSWESLLLIAAGCDPYMLVDEAVTEAAAMSGGASARTHKVLPDYIDTFGWCTWDAFHSQVSAAGVEAGLNALRKCGVPARFVIVDDGWQRVDLDPDMRAAQQAECAGVAAWQMEQTQLMMAGEACSACHMPPLQDAADGGLMASRLSDCAQNLMEEPATELVHERSILAQQQLQPDKLLTGPFSMGPASYPQQLQQNVHVAATDYVATATSCDTPSNFQLEVAAQISTPMALTTADAATAFAGAAVAAAAAVTATVLTAAEQAVGAAAQHTAVNDVAPAVLDALQAAAGATMPEPASTSIPAARAAAAAKACVAAPPGARVGLLQALQRSELPVALWLLSKAWQPAASVFLEKQAVELLRRLLEGATSDTLVYKLVASRLGVLFHKLVMRIYPPIDEYSKRLTCPTANDKFSPAATTACQNMQPCVQPGSQTFAISPAVELTPAPERVAAAKPPEVVVGMESGSLCDVVANWRERCGVTRVFFWHAFFGYWSGISASDPAFAALKPAIVHPSLSPELLDLEGFEVVFGQQMRNGVGITADAAGLYELMHGYLASAGVDGVKVDVQGFAGLIGRAAALPDQGLAGGSALAKLYHTALEASIARHFPGNSLISSMCHSTENLYRLTDSVMARGSDDYFPDQEASLTTHIGSCAYNALFMSPLVLPDWDMFQSHHPSAQLHAVARVISGGPIYVSDRPGEHAVPLLTRLVLPDGSVLRLLLPGRPSRDCLFTDPMRNGRSQLKVWNRSRFAGLLAVFNIQGSSWDRRRHAFHTHDHNPPTLTTLIKPSDVEGLHELIKPITNTAGAVPSGRFAVFSDRMCSLSVVGSAAAGVQVEVAPGGCDMLTVVPLLQLELPSSSAGVWCDNKLGGSCSVLSTGTIEWGKARQIGVLDAVAGSCRLSTEGSGSSVNSSAISGGSSLWETVEFGAIGMISMLNPSGAILQYEVAPSAGCVVHSELLAVGAPLPLEEGSPLLMDAAAAVDAGNNSSVYEPAAAVLDEASPRANTATAPSAGHDCQQLAAGASVRLVVKGHGQLMLHSSRRPQAAMLDGCLAEFAYDASDGRVVLQVPEFDGVLVHTVEFEL